MSKLRTRQGEFTGESSDAQMIVAIDNHLAQIVHHGVDRRAWLIFEATTKAAHAMTKRMNEWGIRTGLVLGETPAAERAGLIAAYRRGELRALVNINALTTGFDVQAVDLLVMRRPTKSLVLYIQQVGRALRTIGGIIQASVAAGKADAAVLDFAGNIDRHGPLDFIRPKEDRARLVSCGACGKRNAAASKTCWACGAPMTKLCPACLGEVRKGVLDCPHCAYDMRTGDGGEVKGPKLRDMPSGAALIASWKATAERAGGWLPVRQVYAVPGGDPVLVDQSGVMWNLPEPLVAHAPNARWVRGDDGQVVAILAMNGASRTSARQIAADGSSIIVPMPSQQTIS